MVIIKKTLRRQPRKDGTFCLLRGERRAHTSALEVCGFLSLSRRTDLEIGGPRYNEKRHA
jgi:hypothetical protein